jgi:hypothetical protein
MNDAKARQPAWLFDGSLWRFRGKACAQLDPGWTLVRVKKTRPMKTIQSERKML